MTIPTQTETFEVLDQFLGEYGIVLDTSTPDVYALGLSEALEDFPEIAEAATQSSELTELIGKLLGTVAGGLMGGPLGALAGGAAAHFGGKLLKWAKGKRAKAAHAQAVKSSQREKLGYKTRKAQASADYWKSKQASPPKMKPKTKTAPTLSTTGGTMSAKEQKESHSIEERMAVLLTTDLDEAVLTERMLTEAVSRAEALLESNGLELNAEDLDGYIAGLQDILENYELAEADRAELHEIWQALVRGAGHVARGIGAVQGTYRKAKAAIGRAGAHIAGQHGTGLAAGEHSKAGPDEFGPRPKKPKSPKPTKPPGASQLAYEKEKARRAALAATPAGQHSAHSAETLKAKQAAAGLK